MLPDNRLVDNVDGLDFSPHLLGANNYISRNPLAAYASGGEKYRSAPAMGMYYQTWECRFNPKNNLLTIDAGTLSEPIVLLDTLRNVKRLNFALDLAMYPYVVVDEEVGGNIETSFYFHSSLTQQLEKMPLGNVVDAHVVLDETRQVIAYHSDIILAYLKNGNLMYRQQRDRFQTERLLRKGNFERLVRCGMNVENRLVFEMGIFTNEYTD